jgi:hypothetical protein
VTRMSKAFGEIGDCSRSDNVNALDATVRPVARTLTPRTERGRSASAPATASSDAYLSSASRRPVLLDSHPKNPLLVLALCLRPPDQTCTTLLRRETHGCCLYWSPVNQRSRVSIASPASRWNTFFDAQVQSNCQRRPIYTSPCTPNLSHGSVQISTVSRPS